MRHSLLMLSVAAVLMAGCAKQESAPAQPTATTPPPSTNVTQAAVVLDEHSYAEPGKVRTKDLALDLGVDFGKKELAGTATYTLEWVDKSATQLVLDTRDLTIVKAEGENAAGQ